MRKMIVGILLLAVCGAVLAKEKTPHQAYKEYLDKKHKGEHVEKKPGEKSPHQVYKEYLDSRKPETRHEPKTHHEPKEHVGKKCGNAYIAHDKICHIGEVKQPAKISPAIIAAPVAAAAAVHAISKPAKPAKIVMTGMCRKDIKLTVFSTAYDLMCFDNPLMCK